MGNYNSILLLKLPYSTHPDVLTIDDNFRTKSTFRPIPSLALVSLCAFVDKYKTYDYHLRAIDVNIEAYTAPGVPIDVSSYRQLLTDCIKNNDYNVIALSATFVFNVRWVDAAVKLSRKYHPEAKIILGGGYPTLFPEKCLKEHDVDHVVIGEGEASLLHILNYYNNHRDYEFETKFPFEGYGSKNEKGEITIFPAKHSFINMKDIPPPAWHYLKVERYFNKSGDRILPIEGSRGCPYNCTYCCTYLSWGRRVRYKPVENLINELLQTNNKYKPRFHFIDDNFSFSKKWFTEFLKELISLKLPLDMDMHNFSVKHLDEEIIDLLIKAGIDHVTIAVESGSREMQKRIRKNINFNKVKEVVKILKNKGMHFHILWMLGFPHETMDQINSTLNLARELKADTNHFSIVLPYPGTRLFEEAKNENLLSFTGNNLDKYEYKKCDYLKHEELDCTHLQEISYDANIEMNFLNNPSLDTSNGREYILSYFEDLLLRLPEHIVSHLLVGYIYKQKNNMIEYEKHYDSAIKLLRNPGLYNTFAKYLAWDYPIIKDFKSYIEARKVEIVMQING
jgi:radical SAM superfamily enzyme YgiQ (UPF0313 family)